MCLRTSCNLHFCLFSVWFLLHTYSTGKYVSRNWSVQSCFSDSVFTLEGRCSDCGADVEANTVGTVWVCSVLLCSNRLTPQVSGLPVVVKIIDGRLMETSLTSLQHRGALSQHSCILYQDIDFFNLPLTLAEKKALEWWKLKWNVKFGILPEGRWQSTLTAITSKCLIAMETKLNENNSSENAINAFSAAPDNLLDTEASHKSLWLH